MLCGTFVHAQEKPRPYTHAHNDYKHKHPLQDAMSFGFVSIEADVFLDKGKFTVAHISPFLKKAELEKTYLQPLAEIIKKKPATPWIYDSPQSLILLVDIKSDAEKTYKALKPLFEKYASILSHYENGQTVTGPVTIILSGNKPYASLKSELSRFAFIDENLLSMETSPQDKNECPLASAKYAGVLKWKGKGKIPEEEKQKLTALTKAAHEQGKKVRLWASPDNEAVWTELLSCGVDLISTDKLKKLSDFLSRNYPD